MRMKGLKENTFIKFLGVGVINTIVGTLVMFGAYNLLHWSYWVSSACNYLVGGIVSFILNKKITFKYSGNSTKAAIKFAVNVAICYLIAYGLAKPAAYRILSGASKTVQENGAMVIGMGLYVLLNYFGQKFFAFRDRDITNG